MSNPMRELEEIKKAIAILAEEARHLDKAAIVVSVVVKSTQRVQKFRFYRSGAEENSLIEWIQGLPKDGRLLYGIVGWRKFEIGIEFKRRVFPFLGNRTTEVENYLTGILQRLVERSLVPVLNRLPEKMEQTGFPDESESEFEDTLKLMERMRFSNSFMFCYSPRPGTPAASFPDSVAESVKKERLQRTIELQDRLTRENGKKFLGQTVETLVEGLAFGADVEYKGKNPEYWRVNFSAENSRVQPGDMVWVKVEEVRGHALRGKLADQ